MKKLIGIVIFWEMIMLYLTWRVDIPLDWPGQLVKGVAANMTYEDSSPYQASGWDTEYQQFNSANRFTTNRNLMPPYAPMPAVPAMPKAWDPFERLSPVTDTSPWEGSKLNSPSPYNSAFKSGTNNITGSRAIPESVRLSTSGTDYSRQATGQMSISGTALGMR